MRRYSVHAMIAVLLVTAGLACLVGVATGLWTVLDGSGSGTLIMRGLLVLLLVLLVSLLPAFLLSRGLSRSIREIGTAIQQLHQGHWDLHPQPSFPAELVELARQLNQLGSFLGERERLNLQKSRSDARELRHQALNRFGQGVAREIQKSLAGVLGFVEIAQRQPGVDGQLKNYLTLIEQEARSGRETLEKILRFVREEPYPTEPLDLNALVVEVSRGFLDTREKEKVKIQMNLAQELPRIMGDAGQLKYVLGALIENAREATLPKGGSLELSTQMDQDGQVAVVVKDTGCGIPPEDQPQVFTPFFTTKGNQKGAGLNLAISERIIGQHGGRLDFQSEPGRGSEFFFHLPPQQPPSRQTGSSVDASA